MLTGASANTEQGARLDIATNGFWGGRYERTYFDVHVFNPHTPWSLYLPPTGHMKGLRFVPTSKVFVRWNIAHSPPLVMSLTGGAGPAATTCFKILASLLSEKWDQCYSSTLAWLRCKLSSALLQSSFQFMRGSCSAASRNVVHATSGPCSIRC